MMHGVCFCDGGLHEVPAPRTAQSPEPFGLPRMKHIYKVVCTDFNFELIPLRERRHDATTVAFCMSLAYRAKSLSCLKGCSHCFSKRAV